MNVLQFQSWLNSHGADIDTDGISGLVTRRAIIQVFENKKAPAITPEQLKSVAQRLGAGVKRLLAVATVESGGSGWDNQGLVKILWERHYFWRRIRIKIPLVSDPKPGGYSVDANRNGLNDSWEKLCLGAGRSPVAAFESASWGKFQIMGAHAVSLGYENAIEFAYAMSRTEYAHYDALARFIHYNGLTKAFLALSTDPDDCREFARRYNGKNYEKAGYHVKLARAMR